MLKYKKESIIAVIYIILIGVGANMVHSVTPLLIQTLGYKDFMFGVLYACMSSAALIFSPLWGSVSDIKSRKLPLVIGPMIYASAQFGFSYFSNPVFVCICRFLAGVGTAGMFGCIYTYLSDYLEEKSRTRTLSIVMSLQAVATACGYLLGGFLGNINYLTTFYVQIGIMYGVGIFAFIFMRETIKKDKKQKLSISGLIDLAGYKKLILSITGIIYILFFIECYSYNAYNSAISYFISTILLIDPQGIGFYMAAIGIVGLIINGFLIPKLVKYLNEFALLMICSLLGASLLCLAMITTNIVLISLSLMVLYAGVRIIFKPVMTSMVLKREKNRGVALGLMNSMESLGGVAGSLTAGFAFEINPLFPFGLASILLLLLFVGLFISRKKRLI